MRREGRDSDQKHHRGKHCGLVAEEIDVRSKEVVGVFRFFCLRDKKTTVPLIECL